MIELNKNIVLDLFSGAGGMAEGFLRAGFEIPYATDISIDASKTYINRHKQLKKKLKFFVGDINFLAQETNLHEFLGDDFGKIDVICGGPPCQGFSIAGKRDPNDPRNQLVISYLKVLKNVKPMYFIMENVVGLLSTKWDNYVGISGKIYSESKVIDVLLSEFKEIGYDASYKVLNTEEFGVPQRRMRVIVLGNRADKNIFKPDFPKPVLERVTVREAIEDLENTQTNDSKIDNLIATHKYQEESREGRTAHIKPIEVLNHKVSNHSEKVVNRFGLMRQGESLKSLLSRLDESVVQLYHTKKISCIRLNPELPSPTITTLPDDIVHYSKNRVLTVRECARLQSFDDSFVFYGKRTTGGKRRKFETPQYSQVGNAVPPLLSYAIANEIKKAIVKSRCEGGYEKTEL